MRYLGLDVGSRRIGVAVGEVISSELTTLVCPKDTNFYEEAGLNFAAGELKKLIEVEQVDALVVGLPVDEHGDATGESKKISAFADKLESLLNIKIHFTDETLTSFMAEEILQAQDLDGEEIKKRVDQVAAQLILQQYLEEN